MATELLGAFQRPILNQDPTVASIPGGATLTLVDTIAPATGTLLAMVSADVSCSWVLTGGSSTETLAGTAQVLSVPVTAGQRVTLTANANVGPAFRVAGSVSLLTAFDLLSLFTAAGQLLAGTGPGTAALLPKGTSGQILSVGGSDPTGLQWIAQASGVTSYNSRTGAVTGQLSDVTSLFTAKGDHFAGTGAGTGAILAIGADTFVLTADSTQATGMKWAASSSSAGDSDQVILPGQIYS